MANLQKKIILSIIDYKGSKHIGLAFEKDETILNLLRKNFPLLRWSQSCKTWHLPYINSIKQQIFQLMNGIDPPPPPPPPPNPKPQPQTQHKHQHQTHTQKINKK